MLSRFKIDKNAIGFKLNRKIKKKKFKLIRRNFNKLKKKHIKSISDIKNLI